MHIVKVCISGHTIVMQTFLSLFFSSVIKEFCMNTDKLEWLISSWECCAIKEKKNIFPGIEETYITSSKRSRNEGASTRAQIETPKTTRAKIWEQTMINIFFVTAELFKYAWLDERFKYGGFLTGRLCSDPPLLSTREPAAAFSHDRYLQILIIVSKNRFLRESIPWRNQFLLEKRRTGRPWLAAPISIFPPFPVNYSLPDLQFYVLLVWCHKGGV